MRARRRRNLSPVRRGLAKSIFKTMSLHMAKDKIRYAVVGAGNIAQVAMLPAFAHAKENSTLTALVSSDPQKRKQLSKKYGIEIAVDYHEYERVLAEVDAVYIALPNHLHREYTERAAERGVHVLCEKPMAISEEDCSEMIACAQSSAVKLMIAYRLHFEEANLTTIDLIKKGTIGEPRIFSSTFSQTARPGDIRQRSETGGGALYDMGVYCINAARYLFRAEPISVQGVMLENGDVDQITTATLRFPGDRVAQLTASQNAADISEYRIIGETGDIRLDPAYGYSAERTQFVTVREKTKKRVFKKCDQFAPQLIYFSRCILDDVQPEPSGEEGLADVRIITAIIESAKSGRAVELAPFDRAERPDLSQLIHKPAIDKPQTIHAPSPSL